MKDVQEFEKDLASIRHMMERSEKFISLSGMSGVMAGIYALAGATAVYFMVHYPVSPFRYQIYPVVGAGILWQLVFIASLVLVASVGTGLYFSQRKAKKHNTSLWNTTSKRLMINLAIPLVTGGLFTLILLQTGHYGIAAPSCLIFYGLGLVNASGNLFEEVRYLGYCEIVLGLVNALMPGYGLVFWALGFGILHIAYGTVMHYRYDT